MMTPEQAVFAAILLCLAGALLTLVVSRKQSFVAWLNLVITAAGAALVLWAAAKSLLSGSPHSPVLVWTIPGAGVSLRFQVDGLAAIFLLLTALIAMLAAFYSIAYLRNYAEYGLARYYPNFLLFLPGQCDSARA